MPIEENEEDLDLDTDQAGKSKTNLILIILIVMILAVGGGVAAVFLLSDDDKDGDSGEDASADDIPVKVAPIYSKIHRVFIINFEDTRKARYVQIEMSIMSRDQQSIDLATEHLPVIRNNFITILSSQKYEVLNTRVGKEQLNADLLKSINDTIATEVSATLDASKSDAEEGEEGEEEEDTANASIPVVDGLKYIEAIYFTSFVMQ